MTEMTDDSYESHRPISAMSSNPSLKPKNESLLGVFYGIGMNVNNVIGSGIVTAPGIVWNSVKSPVIVLLLWLIGGIISMAGSLTYVELGIIHKISGGETKYLQTAYPNPKFLMSYLFSFMFVLLIRPGLLCAVLQAGAQYFWFTLKGYRFDNDIQQDTIGWNLPFSPFWFIKFLAIILLFIITLYHMISNRWANIINQGLAIIKIITYSIIALAGFYRLCQNSETSSTNWKKMLVGSTDITNYSSSILLIMFSYNGWNNLNYSLDEFRDPERKLILSNSISVGIVTAMYLLVNVAFISVVPGADILNNSKIDETIGAEFFSQLFGGNDTIARIFTALIVLSVMGTAAVDVWSGSRVIVAAAKSDFFPKYSYQLRTWHHYFNTPVNALFAQFVWCTFIILFIGGSFTISSFSLFATFSMYSYWIFYFATGIGLLLIRKRNNNNLKKMQFEKSDEELNKNKDNNNINGHELLSQLEKKFFTVPLPVAGIFILAGFFILIFSFVVHVDCPVGNPDCGEEVLKQKRVSKLSPLFISYGFLFVGLLFWYFFYYWWDAKKKQKEANIMRIPAENNEENSLDFN
ncbi:amino acid/polyamine transporter I [Glomus cerebriforme]|uniref:Amino acid/polyamine transporter I n=1 Tax=Glomus cerebriforme TaxID=658196 RepID=A0A397T2U7_9GLOM|nr:amino acid/polyamine transporter I [Glomus cerebriforme]